MSQPDENGHKPPDPLLERVQNIPQEIKKVPDWVGWVLEERKGKLTKVPRQPLNPQKQAASTRPRDWGTFSDALRAYQNPTNELSGIGFVFTPDDAFVGFDLDKCRDPQTGRIAPWALSVLNQLPTYCEISPSGTGIKGIAIGSLPEGKGTKRPINKIPSLAQLDPDAHPEAAIEMYDRGRFFTITGNVLMGAPATVAPHEEAIRKLYLEINPPPKAKTTTRKPAEPSNLTDADLLRVMFNAKNGHKIRALWEGDSTGYASASEGDFALVSHFAFYTGGDERRIDSLFKQSGRCTEERAEKWERLGLDTIKKVVGGMTEFYKPPMKAGDFKGFSGNGSASNGATSNGSTANGSNGSAAPPPGETATDSKEPPPSAFMRTDTGNGELFASMYKTSVRYDHTRGRWLIWRGHWWGEDRAEEIQQFAKAALRYRGKCAFDIEDEEKRKAELSWVAKSEGRSRREAMVWAARSEANISDAGEGWDADPWLIGVNNGVIDLRTGQLRDGRREDRITQHIPIEFDPNAKAPRWEQFLEEVFGDAELVRFIHRGAGYTLTGDTSEQVLFLNHGEGSNGKSIFLEALRDAIGPYAYAAAFSTLDTSSRNKVPQDIASLVGRRFVTAIETNEGVSLNEARVKALTGCDPITARFLFQNEFTFRPVAKFWLAVNHKPRISDDSHGFWRRICLIPFLRKFKGSEIDKKLSVKLKAEAAGILAWAVRGALLWQKEGLNPPEIVVNATREYQQESDALAGFIDECCILGPDYKVKAGEIFKAYQSWCEDQGMNPRERLSSRTFGERLGTRFSKKKENKGVFYFGIGLLSNPQEDSTNFDFERESEGCEGSCTDNAEPRHHEEQHGEGSANSIHTMHTLHQDDQDGEYEEFEL